MPEGQPNVALAGVKILTSRLRFLLRSSAVLDTICSRGL